MWISLLHILPSMLEKKRHKELTCWRLTEILVRVLSRFVILWWLWFTIFTNIDRSKKENSFNDNTNYAMNYHIYSIKLIILSISYSLYFVLTLLQSIIYYFGSNDLLFLSWLCLWTGQDYKVYLTLVLTIRPILCLLYAETDDREDNHNLIMHICE